MARGVMWMARARWGPSEAAGARSRASETSSRKGGEASGGVGGRGTVSSPSRATSRPVWMTSRGCGDRRVLHDEEVGAITGSDAAPVEKAVEGGRVDRGGAQGGRHRHAGAAQRRHHSVQVMVLGQGGGVAVVGAEGGALGAVLHEVGQGPGEVAGGGALADEGPHAQPAALQQEFRVGGLVVGAGAGDHVGGQLPAGDVRSVAVDHPVAGQVEQAAGGLSRR